MSLSNTDLLYTKYSLDVLKNNIDLLDLRLVLATQKLNAYFVVKHILYNYHYIHEDNVLDTDVLKLQPHISATSLNIAKKWWHEQYYR